MVTWPLMVYVMRISQNKLGTAYRELETQAAEVSNILQDTISSIQAIKSFGNEKYEIDRFAECSQNYMDSNIQAIHHWSLVSPILNILNNLSSILVLVFGILGSHAREVNAWRINNIFNVCQSNHKAF